MPAGCQSDDEDGGQVSSKRDTSWLCRLEYRWAFLYLILGEEGRFVEIVGLLVCLEPYVFITAGSLEGKKGVGGQYRKDVSREKTKRQCLFIPNSHFTNCTQHQPFLLFSSFHFIFMRQCYISKAPNVLLKLTHFPLVWMCLCLISCCLRRTCAHSPLSISFILYPTFASSVYL